MRKGSGGIKTLAKRFWAKVDKGDPSSCWNWIGAHTEQGYGKIDNLRAHRVIWGMTNGAIPEDFEICHHCDNPSCVNPSHLFCGTRSDNINDCVKKGRFNRPLGENHPFAKLTPTEVVKIRQSLLSQRKLASNFGVSRAVIRQVLDRVAWKWVLG